MANIILLVFEGAKTEDKIFNTLKQYYFNNINKTIIRTTFNTHIYTLWTKVKNDEFLDIFEVVKNETQQNKIELTEISRNDISEVYLFFDYDGHAKEASDEDLTAMLNHFNNETENGKLYVSYPMVEAVKHIHDSIDFKMLAVEAKNNISYKQLVNNQTAYQDLTKIQHDDWQKIFLLNIMKANFIINDKFEKPINHDTNIINQNSIFLSQLEKYIDQKGMVAVLSAFPFFVIDYYGDKLHSKL